MTGRWVPHVRTLARSASPAPGGPAALLRPASGAALAAVGLAWSVLTVLLSSALRPADCVGATGVGGFIAQNLAQMRSVADCPSGTVGYGPHTVAAVGAASALLAGLVIAHAAASVLACWLGRAGHATRSLLAALARPLPRLLRRWSTPTLVTLTDWRGTAVVLEDLQLPLWRRGPPIPA
ncbi:hypothetical protein [Ruania albidiflava]|uniref:hypothetical protein n=1 Tax=Ruania albidiflava TaxID=366586 RepID=UPI0003B3E093|nr:hypothetical protein [Ruania albidiflava]